MPLDALYVERPADVEGAQRRAAVLVALLEEQRRDQEPAEDEEEVDAEVAAGRMTERMEADDRRDREAPNPVERGPVAEAVGHQRPG